MKGEGRTATSVSRIRQVEIRTRRLVNTLFSGDYKSSFKGRGIEFLDVREYLPGDDVRTIDWKVTARFGRPFVKKFAEERELVVILLVDASGSDRFGTRRLLKLEQAAQVAATLAFSAIRNNDKVGLVFFTDRIEKYVSARKGRSHVLRLIRDILYFQPEHKGTDPGQALSFLMHALKRRAIVFLVSDLVGEGFGEKYEARSSKDEPESGNGGAFWKALAVAARKHDVVVISVNDPAEEELPRLGLVELEDAETGRLATVDARDPVLVRRFREWRLARREEQRRMFHQLGVDHIPVSTAADFTRELHKFFQQRARRYRG